MIPPRLNGAPVSFARVLRLWRHDTDFREFFSAALAEAPFATFTWETPALSFDTAEQDFECALMNAPYLDKPATPDAFRDYFEAGKAMVSFANPRGDSTLVAPNPPAPGIDEAPFASIGPFLRAAPRRLTNALWRATAAAAEQAVSGKPIWISTSGAGVAWLHVRLDSSPKYYRYAPYTKPRM
jgi:hypothetical protein